MNGEWEFAFDDENVGLQQKWYDGDDLDVFPLKIAVPFVYESALSGINDQTRHDVVWYRKVFDIDSVQADQRVILHFGAVDYDARVYINGEYVAHHTGGETPFSVDVTDELRGEGMQNIVVRVQDVLDDETIQRGKQYWRTAPEGIWYTRSTGIWQTVWIEVLNERHLDSVHYVCDIDRGCVDLEVESSSAHVGDELRYSLAYKDRLIAQGTVVWTHRHMRLRVDYGQEHIFNLGVHGEGDYLWSPEHPHLIDVTFELTDGDSSDVLDTVQSYVGLRKVEAKDGMIFLNNRPYYQKLVLDQGYWPDGLLTAPDDDDFRKDIEAAKTLGFNGCRKHQKVEDPRFLYWADTLGFLVWEESAAIPVFSNRAVQRLTAEWTEIVRRDRSHPCIVVWVPLNESWGVPSISSERTQQHYSQALYHLIHALDSTRLVESNDGWEQTETDICAIHNYGHGQSDDAEQYAEFREVIASVEGLTRMSLSGREIFAPGFEYHGQPIVLTECGGIALTHESRGWGYTSVEDAESFVEEYQRIVSAIYASDSLWGFCYTQLTDVEQEMNGLLTYDRQFKCAPERIRMINDGHHRSWAKGTTA